MTDAASRPIKSDVIQNASCLSPKRAIIRLPALVFLPVPTKRYSLTLSRQEFMAPVILLNSRNIASSFTRSYANFPCAY